MSTAVARPDRQQFLMPYLERLAALDGHAESPGVPSRINIGSRSVLVEAWERGVVLGLLKGGDVETGWPGLLAHGVALQVKSLSDLERLGRDTAEDEQAGIRDELTIDAAFAMAMMAEMQWAIDRLVVVGEIDPARKLTRFRNKLGHQVAELRETLGEQGLEQAECLAAELRAEAERALAEANGAGEGEARAPNALWSLERHLDQRGETPTRRPGVVVSRRSRLKRRRSLVLPLTVVLVVSVAAWVVLVLRPALSRVELPVFNLADFREVPVVTEVLAKPPALYVKVDEREWRALSDEQRRRAVMAIGQRIAPAEYTGANLTDSKGRTVARWLKHAGVKLVEADGAGG